MSAKSYESIEPDTQPDDESMRLPEQPIDRGLVPVSESEASGAARRAVLEERMRAQRECDDDEMQRVRQEHGLGVEPSSVPRMEGPLRARNGETLLPLEQSGERRPWQSRFDEIRRRSAENLQWILKKLLESQRNPFPGLDQEERGAGSREMQRVTNTMRVSVNVDYRRLFDIFRDRRLKSRYELEDKRGVVARALAFILGTDYMRTRSQHEKRLGIQAAGTPEDAHPIYGTLCSENGLDEWRGGAPVYGSTIILLRNDRMKSRTSFSIGDSFGVSARELVTWDHAPTLKVIRDAQLEKGDPFGYVEAQVHGGITLEDIEEVKIRIAPDLRERALQEMAPLMRMNPAIRFTLVIERGEDRSIEEVHRPHEYAAAA